MGLPSIIPPNLTGHIYACTQIVDFVGQRCQFSFYYQAAVAVNRANVPNEEVDIADNWLTVIRPTLRDCLSQGTTLVEFRTWCMTWPDIATSIVSTGNQLGTRAGDPLPPQIALVLTKRTLLRGKSGRGRMFLCGMSESDSTLAIPTAALLTNAVVLANTLAVGFVGGTTGSTFNPVVVSLIGYRRVAINPGPPPVPNVPPILFIPGGAISTITPENIWNTQRSRTIGHGR
jgi:hypothetical protein